MNDEPTPVTMRDEGKALLAVINAVRADLLKIGEEIDEGEYDACSDETLKRAREAFEMASKLTQQGRAILQERK